MTIATKREPSAEEERMDVHLTELSRLSTLRFMPSGCIVAKAHIHLDSWIFLNTAEVHQLYKVFRLLTSHLQLYHPNSQKFTAHLLGGSHSHLMKRSIFFVVAMALG